ncbi:MAG: hypothetical protein M0D57_06360 [Sphingobacteriales bacterium JAD_PAG50586_3]|nr:MAG: hypothetical protein M0D57_06360 [Sphingobacteriales bacterium JAD_PAG50586_3]
MSDIPSYHNPKDVPGKFTVVDDDNKDATGRSKIKIRIREKMRVRTRTRKRNSRSYYSRFKKPLQVFLLILAVLSLFYAGYQILVSDLNKPIIIYKKKAAPTK